MTNPTPGKRVALIIGNGAYRNVPALINPRNDAADVGKALQDLGFTTLVLTDLDRQGMNEALDRFSRMVTGAEIALVYYTGHGMQFEGRNYLLPVEARLQAADDINRFRLMPLDDVLDVLQAGIGARVAILDACRNNPVEDELKRRLALAPNANRNIGLNRGLERISAPTGLIVAYSTQANTIAADGKARNSPFTQAFLHNVATPDIDLRQMLFRVQDEVVKQTQGIQVPELQISLIGEFKLKPTVAAAVPQVADKAPSAPPLPAADEVLWLAIRDSAVAAWFDNFLNSYPGSVHAGEARIRLEALKAQQIAAIERERAEQERLARAQAERERLAKEQAEHDRQANEQAQRDRDQMERERLAREQAEREQQAQRERERLDRERVERERLEQRALQEAAGQTPPAVAPDAAQTALLTPPAEPSPAQPAPAPARSNDALIRDIKKELKRVALLHRADRPAMGDRRSEFIDPGIREVRKPAVPTG